MSRHVLRRCDICGKFHVAYLVDEPGVGKRYYCYTCWKARFGDQPPPGPIFPEEREEDTAAGSVHPTQKS